MDDSFDAFRYIGYMRSRWLWIAGSCGVAAALALAISLIQPRQYTATARIVIEPPAGTDLRAAMAVSPIYLESLKTYEPFATGDSLFQKAIGQFDLRPILGSGPIESLKKRVLKVDTVRNTRILEIAATLPDARKAQALAQFLAESTVALNRSMVTESDRDLLQGMDRQEREIRARLEEIESAWARLLLNEPVDDLKSTMEQTSELRSSVQEQAQGVELEIADAGERLKQASAAEQVDIRKQDGIARARLEQMRRQIQSLDAQNAGRERRLAMRQAHRDKLEAERTAAQEQLDAMDTRLREARGEAGFRGERLRIIDPGIVPERPSSPNIPLNVAAAMLLGLVLPVVFLTLRMSYQERAGPVPDLPYRHR
jgi:uncharacterized protein involved in exopolysaccharide biosynthesis